MICKLKFSNVLFNEYKLLNSNRYANTNAEKMLVAKLYTCNTMVNNNIYNNIIIKYKILYLEPFISDTSVNSLFSCVLSS